MPTREARTAWDGGFTTGSGQVELSSSKTGTFDVSFPKRAADEAGGQTSPEELIAAAHSSCFAMALTNEIEQAGATPVSLQVSAKVTLGPLDGGLGINRIELTVEGEVDGMDDDAFQKAVSAAKAGCPVSKALASVPTITVSATLLS